MSVEQRVERVETDLELVKQLLASAASYGESAQRRLDAVGTRLDQQTANQDRLDARVDAIGLRLDEFVFQAQRLIGNQGEKVERLEGAFERIEAIASYVTRKQDQHEALMQAHADQLSELRRLGANHESDLVELRAAVERLDRLMDYLLRRDQGNQSQAE